ncbi:efflux RND transporter periplasmic adaptor subunit [Vibrio sp. DW001]|uniref:efflux RND transporter periplasmic adaptor subunit n=1 Tax=Vibrio sp. DW001 TaxID=2912315 RepID=UPI0023AF5A42|nr:efflux RND transporter periplasmic adaptor subunit [Vibrio sp. DW001]WED25210.1 efflux RND transporter periplasmic adaptor subunit [Vibrio sp. DW001]
MKQLHISLITLLLLTACKEGIESTSSNEVKTSAISVETLMVVPTQTQATLSLYGVLEPVSSVSINVDFSAPIQSVLVEEGDRVKVGQTLLHFDLSKIELKKSQLRHTLAQAKSQFVKAEKNLLRMRELKNNNSVSQQQLDNAQAEFDSSRFFVSAIKSERDLIDRDLVRRELVSPVEGTISRRKVDPNENAIAYTSLLEVEVDESMKVSVFVGEKMLPLIKLGNSAVIKTIVGASIAEVVSIASHSDVKTGNYEVKLLISNSQREYKAGMGVEVELKTIPLKRQLIVPESALVVDKGEYVVFLIKDSVAIRQPVELKYNLNERIHVTSGLKSNDIVAVTGAGTLVNGSLVTIRGGHEQ